MFNSDNYDFDGKYDVEVEDDYDEENYEDNNETEDGNMNWIPILSFISTWFIRIGIGIAIILLIYFVFSGNIIKGLLFILGLIAAFFFGYFFMFCLDRLLSSD